ncbi:undecaprenyl-diphosphate phosphatase [Branchiibius sp. NY16-3462-2]|uniref:undecaprenyl-diphosphate phosphatase n=1 Tax=Branchiibius sp. NY16-3462-2 TaxID=1807500 RepID=UPI0007930486|nr:undecaprenyl-diphosphate phosphatase [Branchiibius sp. NY16-3462-2]KYH45495.1 undecaprenyl-diphosphatase [Branchiibius sp. NY16-3462-2]
MSWLQAIVLGIVQGLTEFLPISSSAHQLIVSRLFFGNDGGGAAFTAVTQLGTEAAVIVYFARDIGTILKHWFFSLTGKLPRNDPKAREGWYVILGTIPIGILGLVFKDAIEGPARNLWLTASMLLIFALVIAVADSTARQTKTLADLNVKDGIFFGLWQALSLIPGVSRSGGTISGGLFMGYDRASAARYSFLLAIPAVLTSGLFELKGAHAGDDGGWGPIIVSTLISFVIGYAVIAWFLRWISTHNFRPFVYYRILLAVLLFVLLGVGALSAT